MAQVKYYISPIDETKTLERVISGTIRDALKEFGIENEPLCVSVNGETQDDVDLDATIHESDVIEIRRIVAGGGGNADTKRTVATVIQVAALVAMTVLSGGGASPLLIAAIGVGSALASGALNKWANDLLAAKTNDVDAQEIAAQTNDYSPKSATNKARPLMPIPVPIGSHRFAPDVHTEPKRTRYAQENSEVLATPYTIIANSGIVSSNGPMAVNNSWITMPAGYISPSLPAYPIKIAPYGFTNKTTALDPSEEAGILVQIKNKILNDISNGTPPRTNWSGNSIVIDGDNLAYPVMMYHFDPSDPWRGRFNLFWSFERMVYFFGSSENAAYPGVTLGSYWADDLGPFFTGSIATPPHPGRFLFASNLSNPGGLSQVLTVIKSPYTVAIPTTMNDTTISTYLSRYAAFLLALNGGTYTTTNKTTAPAITTYLLGMAISQTYAGIPISKQIFNFGIGDVDIKDRNVGSIGLVVPTPQFGFSSIVRDDTNIFWWYVGPIVASDVPNLSHIEFDNGVKNLPNKQLINPDVFDGLVLGNDNGVYNFIYYSSRPGFFSFDFAISGRLYKTLSSGFDKNVTRLQVQYKGNAETEWHDYSPPVLSIENSNTQLIYIPYNIMIAPPPPSEYLEVRIRKINLDEDDNKGDSVSELSIVDACFTDRWETFEPDLWMKNVPFNLEGLYTTGLITDSSTTNQFTALVEARCWVYDFEEDEWSWEKSRNPAWWFLYFARGGFLNFEAKGEFEAPYSPTWGWVNYPGHPNNEAHIFGGGYTDDKIDIDKLKEWAFFCDENDLSIDMVMRDDISVAEALERIANIGRASVTYYGGKLSVVIEDPNQVPTCLFGMGNIIAGSFSVDYSVGDPVRKIVATFTNRETWESDTVEAIVPFSDDSIVKEISIVLDGITEKEQAQREVNILAARQYYQRRGYSWSTDHEGFLANRGDLVFLSHDSTQYGFSGRAMDFVVESGVVVGIKTGSFIDSGVSYITVRRPNGDMQTYGCEYDGERVLFTDPYSLSHAPFYVNGTEENPDSLFPNSIPEDFVFIADIKETTGKRVRISSIEANEDGTFKFKAVDEDPAMWAREYDGVIPPESFDDSIHIARVFNVRSRDMGEGKTRLLWEVEGADSVEIIDVRANEPISVGGVMSFGGGEVVIELSPGASLEVEVKPLVYGVPYKSISERTTLWPQ